MPHLQVSEVVHHRYGAPASSLLSDYARLHQCYTRTKNYQKKITHIGSWAFQKVCALKLQRLYRGYCARKLFRTRLRAYYRATAGNNSIAGGGEFSGATIDESQRQRRKQYYESEITSISNKLDQNLNRRGHQVDSMLR